MDTFNILETLAGQTPSIIILSYICYRLFKLYTKEKADHIKAMQDYTAYLAEQVAGREEVIRNNTKIIAELYKRSASNTHPTTGSK